MPAEDRFASHVVDDESVRVLTTGRLLEGFTPGRLTIGLTDRRLLCVSETDAFTDVRYEYISSIRSRPQTRWEYQYRTGDAVLAGLVGGFLALVFLFVAVGTASGTGLVDGSLTIVLAAATAVAVVSTQRVRRATGNGQANRQLFVGTGVFTLVAFVAAAVVSSSVSLPLFALATGCGLVIAAYGPRYVAAFDGVGLRRHRKTQLTITTVDGQSIQLVTDVDAELDRELSTSLSRNDSPSPSVPLTRSSSD